MSTSTDQRVEGENRDRQDNAPTAAKTIKDAIPRFFEWKKFHTILEPVLTEDQLWDIWIKAYYPESLKPTKASPKNINNYPYDQLYALTEPPLARDPF